MSDDTRAATIRERIARDMAAMDLDTLNILDCVVHTLRTGDAMPNTAVLAAANAWYSAQGGTEEVERLRAAVVAMRGAG